MATKHGESLWSKFVGGIGAAFQREAARRQKPHTPAEEAQFKARGEQAYRQGQMERGGVQNSRFTGFGMIQPGANPQMADTKKKKPRRTPR